MSLFGPPGGVAFSYLVINKIHDTQSHFLFPQFDGVRAGEEVGSGRIRGEERVSLSFTPSLMTGSANVCWCDVVLMDMPTRAP